MRFASAKDDDITLCGGGGRRYKWSRTLPRRSSIERDESPWKVRPRVWREGCSPRILAPTCLWFIFSFRTSRKRERERESVCVAFVVFVERRWKAISTNENKRSDRPLDEPTGVRVTVESLKRVDRGEEGRRLGIRGVYEEARSKV